MWRGCTLPSGPQVVSSGDLPPPPASITSASRPWQPRNIYGSARTRVISRQILFLLFVGSLMEQMDGCWWKGMSKVKKDAARSRCCHCFMLELKEQLACRAQSKNKWKAKWLNEETRFKGQMCDVWRLQRRSQNQDTCSTFIFVGLLKSQAVTQINSVRQLDCARELFAKLSHSQCLFLYINKWNVNI